MRHGLANNTALVAHAPDERKLAGSLVAGELEIVDHSNQIVCAFGGVGEIAFELGAVGSEMGKGATFTIELPTNNDNINRGEENEG